MDAEIETLRKVDALTRSPNKGEAAAARSRLTALLKKRGKTKADLPDILNPPKPAPPTTKAPFDFAEIFARVDDEMERKEPGYKARKAAEIARRKQDNIAYRAAVLKKYGSKDAALAPNAMERAVNEAVAPFARKVMKKFSNGTFPWDSLDGWTDDLGEKPPKRVDAAVRDALPPPTTITEAKAEYDAWEERDDELNAAWGNDRGSAEQLSIGCELRRKIVSDLLYTGLRARTVTEALIRHKALVARGFQMSDKENAALLADLEHLAAMESVQSAPDQMANGYMKPVKQPKRQPDKQADFGF